jgi:predicted nucleotidyltransferase
VAPAVGGTLLQALARLEQPVTRRQLAAAAGVAPGNASAVIGDFIRAGLVNETVAGRGSMVVLNRNRLAAGPLLALAGLRGELIRRLRERLSVWSDVHGAWLFGSVARGDADGESDVDLLIVADDLQSPDLHERLSGLQADVRSWTGNDLQLVEHTPASWRKLVRAKNPLVEQIRLDGIALAGDTVSLLGRQRRVGPTYRKPCDRLGANHHAPRMTFGSSSAANAVVKPARSAVETSPDWACRSRARTRRRYSERERPGRWALRSMAATTSSGTSGIRMSATADGPVSSLRTARQ